MQVLGRLGSSTVCNVSTAYEFDRISLKIFPISMSKQDDKQKDHGDADLSRMPAGTDANGFGKTQYPCCARKYPSFAVSYAFRLHRSGPAVER